MFVNLIFHLKGKYHESLLMHKVTMQKFNSFFKPNNTPNDWISSDRESVDQYTKDPLCGFVVTIGLWKDTVDGLKQIFLKDRYKNVTDYVRHIISAEIIQQQHEQFDDVQSLKIYIKGKSFMTF